MAKKLTCLQAFKVVQKQLDVGYASFLINTQSKFVAASPVDTGRLSSSWVIGKNNPNGYIPPERDGPGAVNIQPYSGEITAEGDWYISSNLIYSRVAAFNPGYSGRMGGKAKGAWFTYVLNQMPKDLTIQLNKAFRGVIK